MSNEQILIDKILSDNPQGIKACRIAKELSIARREINSFLYSNSKKYRRDENYKWYLRESDSKKVSYEERDPILIKLNNRENAKEFELEDFMNLDETFHWKICKSHKKEKIYRQNVINKNGFSMDLDVRTEEKFFNHINKKTSAVSHFGAQNFCIQYKYRPEQKKWKNYFPDFVVYTKDKHIAIVEIKDTKAMTYFVNIDKYIALRGFCRENGFEYMMIDPGNDNITFDELCSFDDIDILLEDEFDTMRPSSKRIYDDTFFNRWYNDNKYFYKDCGYNKKDFDTEVSALILRNNMHNDYKWGFHISKKRDANKKIYVKIARKK